ncbi:MAG: hypothetical protein JSR76_07075 [Verrucomicrobia bacterium]|nr:hypothetical protein [Verrucomicrobiota bacterium]
MDTGSPTGPARESLQWPLLPRTVTPPVGGAPAETLDRRSTEVALDAISRTASSGSLEGDPAPYDSSGSSLSSRASRGSASGNDQEASPLPRIPVGDPPLPLSGAFAGEREVEPSRSPPRGLAPLVPPLPSFRLGYVVPPAPSLAPCPVVRRTVRERVGRAPPSIIGRRRPLVDSETETDEATQTRYNKRSRKEEHALPCYGGLGGSLAQGGEIARARDGTMAYDSAL